MDKMKEIKIIRKKNEQWYNLIKRKKRGRRVNRERKRDRKQWKVVKNNGEEKKENEIRRKRVIKEEK